MNNTDMEQTHGEPLLNAIYLLATFVIGWAGISLHDVDIFLGVILKTLSILMGLGWFILHWNLLKVGLKSFFIWKKKIDKDAKGN